MDPIPTTTHPSLLYTHLYVHTSGQPYSTPVCAHSHTHTHTYTRYGRNSQGRGSGVSRSFTWSSSGARGGFVSPKLGDLCSPPQPAVVCLNLPQALWMTAAHPGQPGCSQKQKGSAVCGQQPPQPGRPCPGATRRGVLSPQALGLGWVQLPSSQLPLKGKWPWGSRSPSCPCTGPWSRLLTGEGQ